VAGEVDDLRNDVEEGFQNFEERAGFPELDWIDGGAPSVDGGDDMVLVGRNLLQGQTFDTLTVGADNAAVTVTMLKPGDSGVSMEVVQGAGALAAELADGKLTVTLAAANSTATEVAAAINAAASCIGVIYAAAGGTGADDVLVAAEAPLTGGVGTYAENKVVIAGVEALPKQMADAWTDTQITVTTPDWTASGIAQSDIGAITVMSDGTRSDPLGTVFAAA